MPLDKYGAGTHVDQTHALVELLSLSLNHLPKHHPIHFEQPARRFHKPHLPDSLGDRQLILDRRSIDQRKSR